MWQAPVPGCYIIHGKGWLPRQKGGNGYTVAMETELVLPALLEVLICPSCHGKVVLEAGVRDGLAAGLRCVGCGRVYPLVDGIPVMLIDRATQA